MTEGEYSQPEVGSLPCNHGIGGGEELCVSPLEVPARKRAFATRGCEAPSPTETALGWELEGDRPYPEATPGRFLGYPLLA